MRWSIICEAESNVREPFRGPGRRSRGVADGWLTPALRGLAGRTPTRLAAAFLATFDDFLDVLSAILFTPGLR
jgi:hypothetical protein